MKIKSEKEARRVWGPGLQGLQGMQRVGPVPSPGGLGSSTVSTNTPNRSSALRWLAGAVLCVMILIFVQRAGAEWWPPPPPPPPPPTTPPPNPDSDYDGMLDAWEIQTFGNLNQTWLTDFDGDGVNNLTEFRMGRNMKGNGTTTVGNSVLNLKVFTRSN